MSILTIYLLCAVTILSLILLYPSQVATPPKGLSNIISAVNLSQLKINQYSSILDDLNQSLSIEDMPRVDSEFQPIKDKVLNLTFSRNRQWIKFTVDFSGADEGTILYLSQLYPLTYNMTLFSPSADGYTEKNINILRSWSEKTYSSNLPSFDIVKGPDSISTYYLCVHNGEGLPLQLSLNLAKGPQFFELAQNNVMLDCFFYGTAVAFLVYSFLLLLRIRDKSYMLYCGYLLFAILGFSVYDNYITKFFDLSLNLFHFLIILPNLQFNLGMRHALIMVNSKDNLPKAHRFFGILLNLHTLITPIIGLLEPKYSFVLTFLLFIVYLGFFAIYMFFSYEKLKIAYLRLFVIGWTLPLIFGVVFGASWMGYFLDPLIAFKLVKFGIAWQAIFASLGIAEQINSTKAQVETIEKEKTIAENTALVKSEFLANMSHELRDPMNRVIGYSSQALSEASPIEKDRFLIKVAENSSHLLNTINNILDFSKMDYGSFKLKNEVFSLADTRQRLIQYFPASDESINFSIKDNTTSPYFYGDPHSLFRVLVNLIGNAFKFTRSGYISIIINEQLSDDLSLLAKRPSILTFKVRDSGIGIETKRIPRLFLPFEQADFSSTRQYEGTGLGLSISSSLVKLMGGTINVTSKLEQGSTFVVSLPFEITKKEHTETEPKRAMSSITNSQDAEIILESSRILLVDDSDLNIEFMTNYLSGKVALIDAACNGVDAISKILRNTYDIVLMDVQMPKMDGYEATEQIRKLGYQHLPIVALSAAATDADEHQSLNSGMNDFISKPVDFVGLHKKINHWVQHARSTKTTGKRDDGDHVRVGHLNKVFESKTKRDEFVANSHRSLLQFVGQIEILNRDNEHSEVQRLAHEAKSVAGNIGFNQFSALLDFISQHLLELSASDQNFIINLLHSMPKIIQPETENIE
ncbi:MAG: response regulator [Pseudomonadales bacterium]|nr:response regulator [Pseudomonadales bacterium]